MIPQNIFFLWILVLLMCLCLIPFHWASEEDESTSSSIIFTTVGRAHYSFDIYSLPIHHNQQPTPQQELRLTDGHSINFNGHFVSNHTAFQLPNDTNPPPLQLVYVTERNGFQSLYYDAVYTTTTEDKSTITDRIQLPLLPKNQLDKQDFVKKKLDEEDTHLSLKDKPSVTNDGQYLIYVSTHDKDSGGWRNSWTAVYSTHLKSGLTHRLTPYGMADYSPALSPSGTWTAVASYHYGGWSGDVDDGGWSGEVEDLTTDIYIFLTLDGTQRVKVVEHGGWPSWVDDVTLYFHRRGWDGWWSIYRAILSRDSSELSYIERVTPPGIHAFTPATSPGNHKFIVVATRRRGSNFRHIELFDLVNKEFKELSRFVSPNSHHFNPFISRDSSRVGYHRCRGKESNSSPQLLLENVRSPVPGLTLFRFIGSFPVFSPSGDQIAYVEMPGVYVVNRDGSNLRKVSDAMAFSTAWDPVRPGIIYTAVGQTFASESTEVDIISIDIENNRVKKLTLDGKNNVFPSLSPDGKWIVFQSGRSGHKNLYVMDAVDGESKGLRRLTEGPWTDTGCNWSPNGEWIAFASDRHNPRSGSFNIYLIHSNGTGLKNLFGSWAPGGRANHPYFSPDGKSIVFTSDDAGISAEPISNPHHSQPYGEIFITGLRGPATRLTHNSYEDGTPAWAPKYMKPLNIERPKGPYCSFDDCHWLNNMPNATHGL